MKKPLEFYVSVDIEATGPFPGDYSMSSIGAFVTGVRYDDGSFEWFSHEDEDNVFYAELKPISEKFDEQAIKVGLLDGFNQEEEDVDGSLRHEWMKTHGKDPQTVMKEFAGFVRGHQSRLGGRPVFVAYPASFDWLFVYWYFMKFDVASPFGFSNVLDAKSVYSMKANVPLSHSVKRRMPKSIFPDLPHTHRADDDAIEQGYLFANIMQM